MTDGVVLLHGILRSNRCMTALTKYLEQAGYPCLNYTYPSTHQPIEALADTIHPVVSAFAAPISGKLHFVGHSMGGLLTRAYLHRYRPDNMGRVVMIGTPNQGSEVADKVKNLWLYRKLYGPAGQQLITNQSAFGHIFGNVNYELGTIAGNRTIDPISSWMIGKPNDGKVSIESARLPQEKDHIIVAGSHTLLPKNKQVLDQTLHFLQHGAFARG